MKFIVNVSEFKKALDKVAKVMLKTIPLPVLRCVHIAAKINSVTLSATNLEQWIQIELPAEVAEPGECRALSEDIKKLCTLKGYAQFSTEGEKLQSKDEANKKKREIRIWVDDLNQLLPPATGEELNDKEIFMSVKCEDLVDGHEKLSKFTIDSDAQKLYGCYYFDGTKERMVVITNHSLAVKRLSGRFKSEKNAIVPKGACEIIKKTAPKNKYMTVYIGNGMILFQGEGWRLYAKTVKGDYFKTDSIIPKKFDFSFAVNAEECKKIINDYVSVINAKNNKRPMYLSHIYGNLVAAFFTSEFRMLDKIETFDDSSGNIGMDFLYPFNPIYFKNAIALFGGDVKCYGVYNMTEDGNMRYPLCMDDGIYMCMILPVVEKNNRIKTICEFLETE